MIAAPINVADARDAVAVSTTSFSSGPSASCCVVR